MCLILFIIDSFSSFYKYTEYFLENISLSFSF